MTCRSDDLNNLHFDTNHLNHVSWVDEADLRQQLEVRIRATILPKA
jgi:hypothetical protein